MRDGSPEFSRGIPLVSLVLTVVVISLHHWYAVTQKEIYPSFLLFLFLFAGLAAGGVLHPPLFYAVGKYGRHLPNRLKVIASACALGGFALGFYFMLVVY